MALWIRFGTQSSLLGADLIACADPLTGWRAVVKSPPYPGHRACVFKIPHHGSSTADEPQVWERLLEDQPIAVVTPYTRSKIPGAADVQRLRSRTANLFATGPSAGTKPKSRGKAVDRTVALVAKNRRIESSDRAREAQDSQ